MRTSFKHKSSSPMCCFCTVSAWFGCTTHHEKQKHMLDFHVHQGSHHAVDGSQSNLQHIPPRFSFFGYIWSERHKQFFGARSNLTSPISLGVLGPRFPWQHGGEGSVGSGAVGDATRAIPACFKNYALEFGIALEKTTVKGVPN